MDPFSNLASDERRRLEPNFDDPLITFASDGSMFDRDIDVTLADEEALF